ncbi:MAG: hypothetical protein NUV84_02435 [Candidatus Uhrbacteria bacterium]|nr:hypothetical protein [Candidatus Uhrbacteria bacterium]
MSKDEPIPTSWKIEITMVFTLVLALLALTIFRIGWVNHIDNYELGYQFDRRTGEISVIPHAGYVITPPILVKVHAVDLRPMQVCINANARVLNCKLVRFNSEGLALFLEWHGRGDYSAMALNPILMSYAYENAGKTYPFLTILRELKTDAVVENGTAASYVPVGTTPIVPISPAQ